MNMKEIHRKTLGKLSHRPRLTRKRWPQGKKDKTIENCQKKWKKTVSLTITQYGIQGIKNGYQFVYDCTIKKLQSIFRPSV